MLKLKTMTQATQHVMPTATKSLVTASIVRPRTCSLVSSAPASTPRRFKYTLGFIRNPITNEILLLNRQKKPWMGRWNGVGGKLDPQESPLNCIRRETSEETGLDIPTAQWHFAGVMRWFVDDVDVDGVYVFIADVNQAQLQTFPATPFVFCHEGILDWKLWDWIVHDDNVGVVDNIRLIFPHLFSTGDFKSGSDDLYLVKYNAGQLTGCVYCPQGQKDPQLMECTEINEEMINIKH